LCAKAEQTDGALSSRCCHTTPSAHKTLHQSHAHRVEALSILIRLQQSYGAWVFYSFTSSLSSCGFVFIPLSSGCALGACCTQPCSLRVAFAVHQRLHTRKLIKMKLSSFACAARCITCTNSLLLAEIRVIFEFVHNHTGIAPSVVLPYLCMLISDCAPQSPKILLPLRSIKIGIGISPIDRPALERQRQQDEASMHF
jgi:hypothetical protein